MKKWLIRIGIGIGVGLLCIAAVVTGFHLYGKAQLTRKIAELKAQGIPTTFAELETKYKLPEGTPNAADIYMKAFAAYRPLADEEKQKMLPVLGCQPDPNDNEPYPPEQMAAAGEFVELNKEMFTLLHEAGQVESCYYPMDYSQGFFPQNHHLKNIRQACQSLKMAAIYYSQTNQSQKVYEAIVDQLRLGQSMSQSHFLIEHLVQIALFSIDVSGIEEIINRTLLDETQLQRLQGHLQQIDKTVTIEPALTGEICCCIETPRSNPNSPSRDVKIMSHVMDSMPYETITLIDAYQRMIAIDKLSIQEQLPNIHKVVEESSHAGFLVFFPRIVLPAIEKVYAIHLRVRANMDCAIMALAIERYRLKEKKLPETVDALVPGYLSQVYIDPFDGKPLRYKKTEPGYMIYTIGEDGVDDGGRGWDKTTKTQDWAFRVYR